MTNNVLPNLNGLATVAVEEQNAAQSSCIYDSANAIGIDANTSHVATFPAMFQVCTIPAATVVAVQAKIHKDADWFEIWRSTNTTGFLQTYQMPYNFIRAIRVSGTGDVKAFAAIFPTDYIG
jgi:hypothetical protein